MEVHIQSGGPGTLPHHGSSEAPEQEAAFFFGLFLRGYSYQELRQDIEVPKQVETEWRRAASRDPGFASLARQMLSYRRRVLAIFQSLVASESPVQ
ncbi:MAG: hypothetical protein ACRD04_02410 [Terriglobales bacterium]